MAKAVIRRLPPEPPRLGVILAGELRLKFKPNKERPYFSGRWRKVKPKASKQDFWIDDLVTFKRDGLSATIVRAFSTNEEGLLYYQLTTKNGAVFSAYPGELIFIKHTRQTKFKFERKIRAEQKPKQQLKLRFRPLFGLIPKTAEEISESNRPLPSGPTPRLRDRIKHTSGANKRRNKKQRKSAVALRTPRGGNKRRNKQGKRKRTASASSRK